MKQLTFVLLFALFSALATAQSIDKRLLLIEYPIINKGRQVKSIEAKTYEGKMDMSDYSQTTGKLVDSEKTIFNKSGSIIFKESERKSLNQKMTIKVHSRDTDYSTTQKQGKHSSTITTELTEHTDTTALYTIEEIGVGTTYKTKELHNNRVITTTQDQNRLILSIDTIEYNKDGYPLCQFTDAILNHRRVEYRHKYNESGWVTITSIKTINFLTNREGEDVEETSTISQSYRYVHEDMFHNWLTRYTFNQNNKLINITIRRIDYY